MVVRESQQPVYEEGGTLEILVDLLVESRMDWMGARFLADSTYLMFNLRRKESRAEKSLFTDYRAMLLVRVWGRQR